MTRRFARAVFFFLAAASLCAEQDPRELLRKVDQLVSFLDSDFSAEYTFVENRPGEGFDSTQAVVFRRDAENKYLILIMAPAADRGKGYLKIGDSLWLYDPVPRSFVFTSASARFRNSNARNSDFTRSSFAMDYGVVRQARASDRGPQEQHTTHKKPGFLRDPGFQGKARRKPCLRTARPARPRN